MWLFICAVFLLIRPQASVKSRSLEHYYLADPSFYTLGCIHDTYPTDTHKTMFGSVCKQITFLLMGISVATFLKCLCTSSVLLQMPAAGGDISPWTLTQFSVMLSAHKQTSMLKLQVSGGLHTFFHQEGANDYIYLPSVLCFS